MTRTSAEDLDALCATASAAARARGHELGEWEARPVEEQVARRAVCRGCGAVAYVRAEAGLQGLAGAALTEACRPANTGAGNPATDGRALRFQG
jgi:hypothetical protein